VNVLINNSVISVMKVDISPYFSFLVLECDREMEKGKKTKKSRPSKVLKSEN